MSDLHDALDHPLVVSEITKTVTPNMPYVTIMGPTVDDVELVVEAARRVANGKPTYLVFTRNDDVGYLGHIYQGEEAERMAANPNLPGEWLIVIDPPGDSNGD